MASGVYDALGIIADFDDSLKVSNIDRRQSIISHLRQMDKANFKVPDFKKGLEWLNVTEPLSLSEHLRNRIVVLDFFTYCCINCMHILPDLEEVEEKFPSDLGIVVIGVHSAKFLNEKVTANVLSAILRYDIKHPVVNDQDATLWQEMAVSCWPTLVFLGPDGQLIYSLAGEGHREWILEFLQTAVEHYSSKIMPCTLPVSLEKDKLPISSLSFPGKICYWPEQDWLVIADTGNHRIVITDTAGVVQEVIGSGQRGLKDGSLLFAEFSSPQGVTCNGESIYVADTGNHCLRQINLNLKLVLTIVGTGYQGTDKEGGKRGTEQEIASPWDLVIGAAPDGSTPVLFIAMAGTHQIWVYFLTDCTWYQGRSYAAGTCVNFAGSGQEENRNNAYPQKAGFAQPSGLALSPEDASHRLYVADSESSSIRTISLKDCKVSGLVGGERDPTNLFAFGDIDGKGVNAKLQHPLGVAYLDGKLIVADSYNHKIKIVDLASENCQTFAGTGQPGSSVSVSDLAQCKFNEPGGLGVSEEDKTIYVADTNNHAIKVIDYSTKTISQLPIVFSTQPQETKSESSKDKVDGSDDDEKDLVPLSEVTTSATSQSVTFKIPLKLTAGQHINMEAPNSWKSCGLDDAGIQLWNSLSPQDKKGKLHSVTTDSNSSTSQASLTFNLPSHAAPGIYTLKLTLQTFACLDEGSVCLPPTLTRFKTVLRLT